MGFHRTGWIALALGLTACSGAAPRPATPEKVSADSGDKSGEVAPQAAAPTASPAASGAPAAPSGEAEKAAPPADGPSDTGAKGQTGGVVALLDIAVSPGARELEAGAQAVLKEDWDTAQKKLDAAVQRRAKANDRPDVLMAGYALLGRSYAKGKAAPKAEAAYRKVIAIWNDPATASALKSAGSDAAGREQRDRAVLAAAEALFFVAEQLTDGANKLRVPEYSGKADRDSVSAFVKTDVAAFIKRKQPVLDEADAAYRRILDLEPVPSRWVVSASAAMAMMRGRFVAELRAAPIPAAWKGSDKDPATGMSYAELRHSYYASLDEISEPLRARARTAFEACANDAKRLSVDDERAKRCSDWLEKNAK